MWSLENTLLLNFIPTQILNPNIYNGNIDTAINMLRNNLLQEGTSHTVIYDSTSNRYYIAWNNNNYTIANINNIVMRMGYFDT